MDEQFPKSALDKFRQWHFWWLVVFSFLLIITFVYYLPTRFLNQSMAPHDGGSMEMPIDESQPHGHEEDGTMDEHMQEHMKQGMGEEEMKKHMGEEHGGEMTEDGHVMKDGQMMTQGPGGSVYHEESQVKEGLAVNLNIGPVPYRTGAVLSLDFFVNQKPGNLPDRQAGVPVLANQLQVEHTKLMHVVGLRSDMNEFFHIHPEFLADNPSIFSIEHTFNKPGLYKVWSSVKKDGVGHTFGHPEISVQGDGPKEEKRVSFEKNVVTGNYQVNLSADGTVAKNKDIQLAFDIHTLKGQEVEVEEYLGADMHLVLIKDDLKQFIHTHPAEHEHSQAPGLVNIALANGDDDHGAGADETIAFTVNFPEAGLYKAFAQFRPKGINLPPDEAITAEFWIQVEEKAPFPVSQWWGLLVVSALLIAGLSWAVNKYLKVKPEDVTVKK